MQKPPGKLIHLVSTASEKPTSRSISPLVRTLNIMDWWCFQILCSFFHSPTELHHQRKAIEIRTTLYAQTYHAEMFFPKKVDGCTRVYKHSSRWAHQSSVLEDLDDKKYQKSLSSSQKQCILFSQSVFSRRVIYVLPAYLLHAVGIIGKNIVEFRLLVNWKLNSFLFVESGRSDHDDGRILPNCPVCGQWGQNFSEEKSVPAWVGRKFETFSVCLFNQITRRQKKQHFYSWCLSVFDLWHIQWMEVLDALFSFKDTVIVRRETDNRCFAVVPFFFLSHFLCHHWTISFSCIPV